MVNYDQDSFLLEQLHADNAEAFEFLYNKYRNPLRYLAENMIQDEMEAQDIVQDFFISLWEKRLFTHIDPSLDKGDGSLIRNYLYRCIHNKCLNYLSRDKHKLNTTSLHETYTEELTPERSFTPDKMLENKELRYQINAAVTEIGPQSAKIFKLAYEHDKSRVEIAAELNISPQTARNLLSRAMKQLRNYLKNVHPTCGTTPTETVY